MLCFGSTNAITRMSYRYNPSTWCTIKRPKDFDTDLSNNYQTGFVACCYQKRDRYRSQLAYLVGGELIGDRGINLCQLAVQHVSAASQIRYRMLDVRKQGQIDG